MLTTVKRSPVMTETEAQVFLGPGNPLAYSPQIHRQGNDCFLMVRGCGSDDRIVLNQLAKLRS